MKFSGDLQAPQVNALWQRRADWWRSEEHTSELQSR